MDDALLVGGFDGIGDLPGDRQRVWHIERSAHQTLGQCRPLDELEHERTASADLLDTVDAGDVLMVERSDNPGLALEPGELFFIERDRRGKELDGDLAPQPRRLSACQRAVGRPRHGPSYGRGPDPSVAYRPESLRSGPSETGKDSQALRDRAVRRVFVGAQGHLSLEATLRGYNALGPGEIAPSHSKAEALMPGAVRALGEVALRVNRLDEMQAFYSNIIGLELLRRFDHAAFFRIADGYAGHTAVIALFDRRSPTAQEHSTLDHLAFTISREDFEPQKQRLEALGLAVATATHDWVRWRSLYVQDPEGNIVEFVCYDPEA